MASIPTAPIPAQPSRNVAPCTLGPRILKIVSRSLSLVGRIPGGGMPFSRLLRNCPAMMRMMNKPRIPRMTPRFKLLVPSSRGGVDATSRRYRRRHPLIGADGVVRNIFDHPVCASEVASQLFLIAQPPLLQRRGLAAVLRFHPRSWSPTLTFLHKK